MNKVLLIGRLVRDPETNTTTSGIKYCRFTIATDRPFGENQTDFIPIVAWRHQATFIEKYIKKGSLISIEGRFTSSTYQNSQSQTVYRYEITADRIEGLETRGQIEARKNGNKNITNNLNDFENNKNELQNELQFEEENKDINLGDLQDVPWELDL